jgi:hypothetical protein
MPSTDVQAAWRDCLANSAEASHYASPEFFLEPFFINKKPFAILATSGDTVEGVVTGIRYDRRVECGLGVRPQICRRRSAERSVVNESLISGLLSLPEARRGLVSVYCWEANPEFSAHGFAMLENADAGGSVMLDLRNGSDAVFKGMSETRRNKIRRSKKAGIEIARMILDEDFDDYYGIYADWCAFKGIAPHPREIQRQALASSNRLVLVAKQDQRLIGASIFRFYPGGLVEYAANVSRREDTKVRQNDLLMWSGIEWACEQGFQTLCLGGNHFFLRTFGGQFAPTYRYRRDGTLLRSHDVRDGVRRAASEVFKALPISIQNRVR